MTEVQPQSNPSSNLGLGEKFVQKREAMNLSLDDVAKKLNFRKDVLQEFESNNFIIKGVDPIFVKGYVKGYARLLNINEKEVDEANLDFGVSKNNDLGAVRNKQTHLPSTHSNSRWIIYLTVIILLAAVGMSGLWWWQDYQAKSILPNANSLNSTDTIQSTAQATDNTATTSPVVNLSTTVKSGINQSEQNSNTVSTEENKLNQTNNPFDKVLNSSATDTTATDSTATDNTGTDTTEQAQTNAIQPAVEQTQPTSVTTPAVTTETTSTVTHVLNKKVESNSAIGQELRIEITNASCWLSVKDAVGKELAGKEYKKGDVLTFDQAGPFSLIIGAPKNVTVTYQGKVVQLRTDGKIEKIKLSK